MADPIKYTRQFDYSAATLADLRSNLNPEFSTIEARYGPLVEAVKDIRRSDGALQNEIVTEDSLHPDLLAILVFEDEVWTVNDFTQADIDNWNTAFSWGDHAAQNYLEYDNGIQVDDNGDARGDSAVDLQSQRSSSNEVASGLGSFIAAGLNNRASGSSAITLAGLFNVAQGSNSVAAGASSSALGNASVAMGTQVSAQADYSVALGRLANVSSNHPGAMVLADSLTGSTRESVQSNSLSLFFFGGAYINGNEILDSSDLLSNGGTILDSAGLADVATSGDHSDLNGAGTNTHAQIDTHIADSDIHRPLDDSRADSTVVWSGEKIDGRTQDSYGFWILDADITMVSGNASEQPFDLATEQEAKGLTTDGTGILPGSQAPFLLVGVISVDSMDTTGVVRIVEVEPGVSSTTRLELPLPEKGHRTFTRVLPLAAGGNYIQVIVAKVGGDGTISAGSHLSITRIPGTT